MSNNISKNDEAWGKIFIKHDILSKINKDGQYVITADEIKKFREPRLMTKFDQRKDLPEIFTKNHLSILPITRGSYSISHFKVYHKFEEVNSPIIEVPYPDYIQSINWEKITSESTAINIAYISEMLANFLSEDGLLPTVNGRMGSKKFEFSIFNHKLKRNQRLKVTNSQIEIDGGFEGFNSLSLIEAKNILSEDFLVRQLYYPYRLWKNQVNKPVRPIYLTYSNNVFSLYEYDFIEESNYNSLELIKSGRYTLRQEPIILNDIIAIYNNIQFVPEDMSTPFVQADSFYRVINMCELLVERSYMTSSEIALEYGFAGRQSDYYFNAGKYLGLMCKVREDDEIRVKLTKTGKKIMEMATKERNLAFVRLILSHEVFYKIFRFYLDHNNFPELNEYIRIMKESNLNMSFDNDTPKRRSSSITGWINWILDLSR